MRKLMLVTAAVLALGGAGHAAAATRTVQITRTGFTPSTLSLAHGDTVTWRNADTVEHQVVANGGSFASPILKPGASYSFTFTRAGTFGYHDALKPSLKGTIRVSGPPPSMTLAASIPIVFYGTGITLGGTVSSGRSGESVTVYGQEYGQPSPVQLATVVTGTGGSFGYATTPHLYTTYYARWKSAQSGNVVVQVAPRIQFIGPKNGYYKVQVTAAHAFAGRVVYLQRLSPLGQWVSIRKLVLGQLSGKLFTIPRGQIPRGYSRLRIFMTINQAGVGYLSSYSPTKLVVRSR
jgi:plastocyanin